MGNCCSSNQYSEHENLESIKVEQWFAGNDSFDGVTFNRSIELEENLSFQRILRQAWKNVDLESCTKELPKSPRFNTEAYTSLRCHIQMGVPNFLIRNVILKIIYFDDDSAHNNYSGLLDCLDVPDFLDLPRTMEPFFGRKDLTNAFLTIQGIISCKRILYVVQNTMREVEVCLILPRFVQLLLWFLREHEVYQIASVLIQESKTRENCPKFTFHFPLTLLQHKQVARVVLQQVKLRIGKLNQDKMLKLVVKDMIYNMLVGYISPSFYPLVLMYFITEGIGGLMRIAVSLIIQNKERVGELLKPESTLDDLVKNWKRMCLEELQVIQLLKGAHQIKIDSDSQEASSINTFNDFFNYLPPFEGNSSILTTNSEVKLT